MRVYPPRHVQLISLQRPLVWGESGGGIGFQVVMVLGTGSGEENGGEKKGGGGRRKYEI